MRARLSASILLGSAPRGPALAAMYCSLATLSTAALTSAATAQSGGPSTQEEPAATRSESPDPSDARDETVVSQETEGEVSSVTVRTTSSDDEPRPPIVILEERAPAPSSVPARQQRVAQPRRVVDAPPPDAAEEEPEDEAPIFERDDGRLIDFVWFEVEGGVSYVDLIAFQNEEFAYADATVDGPSFTETSGWGGLIGAALGIRLWFFGLGARFTYAGYDSFGIGTLGGEVQLRLPIPIIEPWLRAGAGYAWQSDASYADPRAAASQASIYGWNANAALGFDIFLTWWLSLGAGVSVDVLNMARQSDPTANCMGLLEWCPSQDGDAVGAQGRVFGQIGFHL